MMLLEVPAALKMADIAVILGQTFAYGIFIFLLPITTFVFLTRGTRKTSNTRIFALTIGSFTLSTGCWAVEATTVIVKIVVKSSRIPHLVNTVRLNLNFHAFALVNLVFADGVVVWRMRALCSYNMPQKVLAIPVALLIITSCMVCITIGLRIYGTTLPSNDIDSGPLLTAINVVQVGNQLFSLGTNICATSVIARWAWQYRKLFKQVTHNDGSHRRLIGILVLLIESGAVYCISSTFLLLGVAIQTPLNCTLGDIYLPMHAQIAGMYPALVMILVNSQSSTSSLVNTLKTPARSAANQGNGYNDLNVDASPLRFHDGHAS